jgi:hypothetical protein
MSGLRERLAKAIDDARVFGTDPAQPSEWDQADAAILALRQWMDAEGLVCVPRGATEEMLLKGEEEMAKKDVALILRRKAGEADATETVLDSLYAGDVYTAMIAAAPDVLGDTHE